MKLNLKDTTFLAIVACLLWSSAFTGVKVGLAYTTPLYFAGLRFTLSGLFLFPFAYRILLNTGLTTQAMLKVGLLSILQVSLQYGLFYLGLSRVEGATGAIVIGSSPLFVAIASHFYMKNDKLTLPKMGIITLGFLGVVLVSLGRNGGELGGQSQSIGIILLLLVNVASAGANILVAKDKLNIHPLIFSSLSMVIGGLVLTVLGVATEKPIYLPKQPAFYISLIWLCVISSVAVSIWFFLLKREGVKVSNLNLWKFLIPVSGALLAWLVLPNENPNVTSVLGMLITGVSLIGLNYYRRKVQKL